MKTCTLIFSVATETPFIALNQKEILLREKIFPTKERINMLKEIDALLTEERCTWKNISDIFFVNGGTFSQARLSCLIGNTLSQELDIPLFVLPRTEFQDKEHLLQHAQKTSFAEPLFETKMRIGA